MILSNRQALVVILAAAGLQNTNGFVPPSLQRCSPRTTSCAATAVDDRIETPEAEAAAAVEDAKLIMDIPPEPAAVDEIEEMKLIMDVPPELATAKETPEKRNPLRSFYSVSVRKEAAAAVEETKPASAREAPKKKNPLPNFFSCSVPKEAAAAVVETKPIMDTPPKPAEAAEKPKPVAVAEKPKPVAVAEKPKLAAVAEKPKPAAVEKPKPVVAEKPKPAVVVEKPKPVAAEKPKPVAVAEKPKPAAVAEKRKRSVSPWPTPALTEKAKQAAAEKPKTVAAAKAKPAAAAEKPKPAAVAEKKRSISPWPTPAVVNIKKAPEKKGGHKEGVFSPIVYGAAGVMGEGQLKVVRARVISVHSDLIKSFIGTSDSAFGEATLKQLFNLADADDSGYLDKEELAVALNMLGFKWLDGKQVDKIFAKADANGDERISLEEFMEEAPKVLKMNLIKLAKANGTEMGLMV